MVECPACVLPQVQLKWWNYLIMDQDSQKRTINEENQMNASHRFLCRLSFYKTDLQDSIHCKHLILTRIKLPITLIIFVGLGKFRSLHWDVATPTDSCTRVSGVYITYGLRVTYGLACYSRVTACYLWTCVLLACYLWTAQARHSCAVPAQPTK